MILHTCPVCAQVHQVREARAQLAYGRQFTCSADCESERRKRMRCHVAHPGAAKPGRPSPGEIPLPATPRASPV